MSKNIWLSHIPCCGTSWYLFLRKIKLYPENALNFRHRRAEEAMHILTHDALLCRTFSYGIPNLSMVAENMPRIFVYKEQQLVCLFLPQNTGQYLKVQITLCSTSSGEADLRCWLAVFACKNWPKVVTLEVSLT